MSDVAWRVLGGVVVVAMLYMLVRPGSPASQAVADVGSALRNLVAAAVQ